LYIIAITILDLSGLIRYGHTPPKSKSFPSGNIPGPPKDTVQDAASLEASGNFVYGNKSPFLIKNDLVK
jgi:hypothetical protein